MGSSFNSKYLINISVGYRLFLTVSEGHSVRNLYHSYNEGKDFSVIQRNDDFNQGIVSV